MIEGLPESLSFFGVLVWKLPRGHELLIVPVVSWGKDSPAAEGLSVSSLALPGAGDPGGFYSLEAIWTVKSTSWFL